jgi:hypothetical protein
VRRVESILNNSNKLGGVVHKGLKGAIRNKEEVDESWEKNLRPGRLTNEVLCVGDQSEGIPHNRGVRGGLASLLRHSSDLQLRFLGCLIVDDIATGMDLLFISNNVVTRTRYTYDRDLVIFTLDGAGQTDQLFFGLSEFGDGVPNNDAPCFPGCDHAAGQVG